MAGCSPGSAAASAIKPRRGFIFAISLMWRFLGHCVQLGRQIDSSVLGVGVVDKDPNVDNISTNLGIVMD